MSYPSWGGTGAAVHGFPGWTAFTAVMPTDIALGDLVFEYFQYRKDTPVPVVTWPAGWTQLFATSTGSGDILYQEVRYRVCDGSEVTFNITTDVTCLGNTRTVRLLAGSYAGTPEVAFSTHAASTSHPGNLLTPSWGVAHTLWLASAAVYGVGGSSNFLPTTNDLYLDSLWTFDLGWTGDTDSFPTSCIVIGRQAEVASLTPPPFLSGGSVIGITATIAIQGTPDPLGLVIAEVTSVVETGDVTAATLVMPSEGEIGDVVFAVVTAVRNGGGLDRHSFDWSAGDFTQLISAPTAGDPETLLDVYYRILDGTEPATYAIPYANPAFTNRKPGTLVLRIPGAGPPFGATAEAGGTADPLPYPTHTGSDIPSLWIAIFGVPTGIWHSTRHPSLNLIPVFKFPSTGYTMGSTLHGTASTLGNGLGFQAKIGTAAAETPGATDLSGAQHYASATIGLPLIPQGPWTVIATLTLQPAYEVGSPDTDTVTITV